MSWYLFNNSPQRQFRGKKVDGYQNQQKTKVNLDWGLGELSPKKTVNVTNKPIQKAKRTSNSEHQQSTHTKPQNSQKRKIIQQAVKILTESSDDQSKEQLMKVLKNYDKKHQSHHSQIPSINHSIAQLPVMDVNKHRSNKSTNVLNTFQFDSGKTTEHSKTKTQVDLETAKRMRFLENSLLPDNKRDNMTAILDFELNQKVSNEMTESRVSRKSHFANKKNQSAVQLGDGFNAFMPIKEKVKDMNQRLKEMYDYDEWCRKREKNELKLA